MNIAFCVNRLGLIGLGVTVISLIRNCSTPDKLRLFFLCADVSSSDKKEIENLLKTENFLGSCKFIDFDPVTIFGSFRSLHGDWTTYGRLLLSDLIEDAEVLYLDSDLVIEVDVLELSSFNFNGKALAAVPGGTLKTEIENDFYINKVGLNSDLESFNAGILFFNLREWRLKQLKERCFELANRFPNDLISADQSILNAVFAGNFSKLPLSFNCPWPPNGKKPIIADQVVNHFVGSPKPWDLLGSVIHNGFNVWKKYSNRTWERRYNSYSFQNFKRTWNLRRSYFRVFKNKIKL
ncbi:MAG: glycosyltransferase family 8 protein [Pyrinomonadaceae bacterium]|nr:glycosyltransferase family 8 protein [Sphingobacteriaceae bacterium]